MGDSGEERERVGDRARGRKGESGEEREREWGRVGKEGRKWGIVGKKGREWISKLKTCNNHGLYHDNYIGRNWAKK